MQVMINLLDNAFKFTNKGSIALKSSYKNGIITLIVSDTGIGIRKKESGQLFSPFQQEDSSPTRKYGGTGMGLAITHNLVEKMGGDIALSSKPGVGSTFIIKFPLKSINSESLQAIRESVILMESKQQQELSGETPVDKKGSRENQLALKIKLDQKQQEILGWIIAHLRKCQKIFDEDQVKQEADNLLLVSSDPVFTLLREKLYIAAENYESTVIDELCRELESIGNAGQSPGTD